MSSSCINSSCINSQNTNKDIKDIEEIHKIACEQQQNYYIDPKTGYRVFTSYYLQNRGKCCNSGCRHCPYKNETASI